jgi:hypothetical protein
MSRIKANPPFPLKHKKFDWDKFMKQAEKASREWQERRYQEGLKHCRCCPAHPEYERLDHSVYE